MCRAYLVTEKTDDALASVVFVFYSHWKHLTTKEEKSTIASVIIFSNIEIASVIFFLATALV